MIRRQGVSQPGSKFERAAFIPEPVFETLKRHKAMASHRATIDVLYLHADRTGMCYPGEETIAHETGCTVRTVRRAIRDLESWGLVEIALGGGAASNTYFLQHVFRPRTPDTGDRGMPPTTTTPDARVLQPRTPVSPTPDTQVPAPRTPVSSKQSLKQSSNTPLNSSPRPRAAEERDPGERIGRSEAQVTAIDPREQTKDPRLQELFGRFLDHATMTTEER